MKIWKFAVFTVVSLVLSSGVTQAQKAKQKPQPKPVTKDPVKSAQLFLTQKIRRERKNQTLSVTLDTTAPYSPSALEKGVRGTGTILTPKTGKQEMFAYDVLIHQQRAVPKISYRLMKGVVTTSDGSIMEYQMTMAQNAVRSKIQRKEGKTMIVTFKSVIPAPLTEKTTQFRGEGGFGDGKTRKRFQFTAMIDAAKGQVREANYTIVPDQKVNR